MYWLAVFRNFTHHRYRHLTFFIIALHLRQLQLCTYAQYYQQTGFTELTFKRHLDNVV